MLELGIRILVAYLLGSVIGSLVVGRFYGNVDIRKSGSGNAGATNALRTQGKIFALWVMLIDAGKGILAAGIVPYVHPAAHLLLPIGWVAVLCGLVAIAGHVFPVFFRFHGGKGAATLLGVLLMLSWPALLAALIVWVLMLVLSGYVSLATILAVCSVPVYTLLETAGGWRSPLFWFGLATTAFILYTHRSNLRRLSQGNENRFTRAMLLHRLRR